MDSSLSRQRVRQSLQAALLLFVLVVFMVACDTSQSLNGQESGAKSEPLAVSTSTLGQVANPDPTQTRSTPSKTSTAEPQPPTVTTQPTSAISPTSTADPTRIPGQIGPDNFPENVNPLTGLVVEDPAVLNRRPLAIKVANTARVRPQAGLNQADLVFEHYSEGGITRFTAVFYTHTPTRVGSIRSGRLIDLEIPLMYDAAFAYSGSSYQIKEMIRASIFFDRVISPDFGHSGFWRTFDAKNPSPFHVDSLFTNPVDLRQMLVDRGQEVSPTFHNGMVFHPDPPAGGTPVSGVEVIYSGTGIYWEYQPATGRFNRWSDGQRHLDVNDGQIMNFKNIIIVRARHLNTEIIEDSAGSPSIQIQIWGEGPVTIYRDGYQYEGVWRRAHPLDMLTFYDNSGAPIPLAPGNSFIELVPLDFGGLQPRLIQ